jgi:Fic family protein
VRRLSAPISASSTEINLLDKARFLERFAQQSLNARQVKVLNSVLDRFEGELTTSKWAKLAKCSQDTVYRDILELVERGALRKDSSGGRSRSYSLTPDAK